MKIQFRASLLTLAAFAAFAGTELNAQTTNDLTGIYAYVPSASDDIETAIRAATDDMNFIVGPIARGRLRKTNYPYETIQISATPQTVTIVTDGRAPIVTSASGSPIEWQREDGETFDVSTRFIGGSLEQTFQAEDGTRANRYTLDAEGNTLTMMVTVSSPKLEAPMVYSLVYQRQ